MIISKCNRFVLEKPFWIDINGNKTGVYTVGDKITLCFNFTFKESVKKINPGFAISDFQDQRIFTSHLNDDYTFTFKGPLESRIQLKTVIDLPLSPAIYKVVYGVRDEFDSTVIYEENVFLEIQESLSKNGAGGILWHTTKWSMDIIS